MQVKGNWMQTTTFEETESVILPHACLMILMIGVVLWDSGKWLAEWCYTIQPVTSNYLAGCPQEQ